MTSICIVLLAGSCILNSVMIWYHNKKIKELRKWTEASFDANELWRS